MAGGPGCNRRTLEVVKGMNSRVTTLTIGYATDPTKPINDWKEAWEGAKKRAGAVLMPVKMDEPSDQASEQKPRSLVCRFHDLRHTCLYAAA